VSGGEDRGPEFDPGWWETYGKTAAVVALGVIVVTGIIVLVLVLVGAFD
jgi:hypothetical protein